ncbi:MAG TPA: carbohydrate-binding family 9-like protein [Terriglobales bacterium]|nr:carbohydrate-binding family 9-like protein [Terriglobales bacterium]
MKIRLNLFSRALAVFLLSATCVLAADNNVIESTRAPGDTAPQTDPASAFWQKASPVYAEKDTQGKPVLNRRMEVRSRWTNDDIYFLFICPYEALFLKPAPDTVHETNQLWNWDVAEVFIGSDFKNIKRYKEFEVSPQGEWIDLDIDLDKPHHEDGWVWNSGFQVVARIDRAAKVWYGAMRIPLATLEDHTAVAGDSFRVNLFSSQGKPPDRKNTTWQPTMSDTFHVPERFGTLKLVDTVNK